jgi:hypothetical protein
MQACTIKEKNIHSMVKLFQKNIKRNLVKHILVEFFQRNIKRKLSEIRTGKKHSDETRRKISEAEKGENHWRWGTSVIDEWGGIWFLKEMKKQVGTMKKLQEYTGITIKSTYAYLRRRGLKWSEI